MADLNDLSGGDKLSVPSLSGAVAVSANKELMADARLALTGSWLMAILGYVVYGLLIASAMVFAFSANLFIASRNVMAGNSPETALSAGFAILQVIFFLISGPLTVGWCGFFLSLAGGGVVEMESLFVGFRRFWKSIVVYIFFTLFIFLWSLLLVIPGIIATYRYAMAFYIIADDEDCGPLEALIRSKDMMKGHKWKFFCLQWRFFGWAILASLTGGIGYLWLIPYMHTTFAKFYEDVS